MRHEELLKLAVAIVESLGYPERLRESFDAALASDSDAELSEFVARFRHEAEASNGRAAVSSGDSQALSKLKAIAA